MTTLFGIKNCDTIKKARKWLEQQQIEFNFHDYRSDGLEQDWLQQAESQLGWEVLLNKRGTTYRQLDESQKQDMDKDKALALLMEYPAMIKRPVLQIGNSFYIGFKPEQYRELF